MLRDIEMALEKVNFDSSLTVLGSLEVLLIQDSRQWKHLQGKENRESTGIYSFLSA